MSAWWWLAAALIAANILIPTAYHAARQHDRKAGR